MGNVESSPSSDGQKSLMKQKGKLIKKVKNRKAATMGPEQSQDEDDVWYYPPHGNTRTRYMLCSICTFKTVGHAPLNAHMRKYHSSIDPMGAGQSDLMSTKPTYESVKIRFKELQKESALMETRPEWYYPPNGQNRCRYRYCLECDFKTSDQAHLESHVKLSHSLGDAVDSPEPPKKRKKTKPLGPAQKVEDGKADQAVGAESTPAPGIINIAETPAAPESFNLEEEKVEDGKPDETGGTESISTPCAIVTITEKPSVEEATQIFNLEEKEKSAEFERFGLRKCSVVLEDISSFIKEVAQSASVKDPVPEGEGRKTPPTPVINTELQSDDESSNSDLEILEEFPIEENDLLLPDDESSDSDLEILEEFPIEGNDMPPPVEESSYSEVEEIESARNDLQERISELRDKRKECKCDVHFLQLDLIDLRLGDPETDEVDATELHLVENRIRSLNDQVNEIEEELGSLRELDERLLGDLKKATMDRI